MNYHIIIINPPIYDFTCYNLWLKPLGLLYIASIFKHDKRCKLYFIDCINEKLAKPKEYERGCGKLHGVIVEKPKCYSKIRRNYYRYGMSYLEIKNKIEQIKLDINNDKIAVLIGTTMTYWYLGIFEVCKIIKEVLPNAKIILGGIYAKLMYEHAKKSSLFDFIETSSDLITIKHNILKLLDISVDSESEKNSIENIVPAYEFLSELNNSVAMVTSFGCPYKCTYCASKFLYPKYIYKDPKFVLYEIKYFIERFKISNIAFYDDALLFNKNNYFYIWAKEIINLSYDSLSFHLPNAIHAAMVDFECAQILKAANFQTIRLGYEFFDSLNQKKSSGKVDNETLKLAITNLLNSGYKKENIGVYILYGHPLSDKNLVKNAIDFVLECNATPYLSLYSPIAKTIDGENIFKKYPEILEEPLLQNKSIFFELYSKDQYETYYELKSYIQKYCNVKQND